MPSSWKEFLPAPVGWYAWYREIGKPTGDSNFCSRRPIVGWAVHRDNGTNTITMVVAMILATGERDGTFTAVQDYHTEAVVLIGLEWPGMTNGERDLMLTVEGPGHMTFTPTTRRGHG